MMSASSVGGPPSSYCASESGDDCQHRERSRRTATSQITHHSLQKSRDTVFRTHLQATRRESAEKFERTHRIGLQSKCANVEPSSCRDQIRRNRRRCRVCSSGSHKESEPVTKELVKREALTRSCSNRQRSPSCLPNPDQRSPGVATSDE